MDAASHGYEGQTGTQRTCEAIRVMEQKCYTGGATLASQKRQAAGVLKVSEDLYARKRWTSTMKLIFIVFVGVCSAWSLAG